MYICTLSQRSTQLISKRLSRSHAACARSAARSLAEVNKRFNHNECVICCFRFLFPLFFCFLIFCLFPSFSFGILHCSTDHDNIEEVVKGILTSERRMTCILVVCVFFITEVFAQVCFEIIIHIWSYVCMYVYAFSSI